MSYALNMKSTQQVTLYRLTLYQVITNSDRNEGRGADVTLGWYFEEGEARRAAREQGVFGSDAAVKPSLQNVVTINNKSYLLGVEVLKAHSDPAVVRREALAKLTDEELIVLGLKR